MKILAEILTGSSFYVEVEENATVGDLKTKIGNQENLPTERLILMLDTDERPKLNNDEASLNEYNVQDGSRIYIFFETLGDDTYNFQDSTFDWPPNDSFNNNVQDSGFHDPWTPPPDVINEPSMNPDPSSPIVLSDDSTDENEPHGDPSDDTIDENEPLVDYYTNEPIVEPSSPVVDPSNEPMDENSTTVGASSNTDDD